MGCKKEETSKTLNLPTISQLKNGDIICRKGNGFFSNQFVKFSPKKTFSHIGIITLSSDSIFVLHAEANEYTGIGEVHRDSIQHFLDDIESWAIYRLNKEDSIRNKIPQRANYYRAKNTPFDLSFDSYDDSEVYCTELVALAINYAVDSIIIKPSYKSNFMELFLVDDIYCNPNLFLVCKSLFLEQKETEVESPQEAL